MSFLTPPNILPPKERKNDPRLYSLITPFSPNRSPSTSPPAAIVLIGFPFDEGALRNGGRGGAAAAPDQIRNALYSLTPDARAQHAWEQELPSVIDLGNIDQRLSLDEAHAALGKTTAEWLNAGARVVILGGSHDVAYGHFLAYSERGAKVQIVNIDSHPDVRETLEGRSHSGSPFRQCIEHSSKCCEHYQVLQLSPWSVSGDSLDYLKQAGATYSFSDDQGAPQPDSVVRALKSPTLLSFDLDCLDQSIMPGVSAPNANGAPASLLYSVCFEAGKNRAVQSLDLAECNPSVDVSGNSVRPVALGLWHFFRGHIESR